MGKRRRGCSHEYLLLVSVFFIFVLFPLSNPCSVSLSAAIHHCVARSLVLSRVAVLHPFSFDECVGFTVDLDNSEVILGVLSSCLRSAHRSFSRFGDSLLSARLQCIVAVYYLVRSSSGCKARDHAALAFLTSLLADLPPFPLRRPSRSRFLFLVSSRDRSSCLLRSGLKSNTVVYHTWLATNMSRVYSFVRTGRAQERRREKPISRTCALLYFFDPSPLLENARVCVCLTCLCPG